MVTGWKLDPADRVRLLSLFPPRFTRTVADHITLRFGTDGSTAPPGQTSGEVIGEVDDAAGVQALVVQIDGTTDRGDGSHFHITWSLAPGRRAKESNDVIARLAWRPVDPPLPIRLEPSRWAV
jgi:hypothetical protein